MRSSLACRLFSCSVLGAVLLVAGCGTDQETGLLALSISADPTNPPMPASKIVLTGPGFTRTYTGPFPPGGDAGATLVLEYPNLPTSSSPVALTVQAYDSNGCQVGAASVPVSVTIQAGVKNGPFPVTLAAVAACGDGGILRVSQDSGAGAAEAGGLDARADGPPTGDAAADKPADASVPSSGAEVSDGGGDTGTGGTTESGDAWVPDAPDGQPMLRSVARAAEAVLAAWVVLLAAAARQVPEARRVPGARRALGARRAPEARVPAARQVPEALRQQAERQQPAARRVPVELRQQAGRRRAVGPPMPVGLRLPAGPRPAAEATWPCKIWSRPWPRAGIWATPSMVLPT